MVYGIVTIPDGHAVGVYIISKKDIKPYLDEWEELTPRVYVNYVLSRFDATREVSS